MKVSIDPATIGSCVVWYIHVRILENRWVGGGGGGIYTCIQVKSFLNIPF